MTADTRPVPRTASTQPWIAMYHSVDRCPDDPYRITVTPERLDAQLARLRRRGLTGVSMAELLRARAEGRADGLVGLTFDDGYQDFVDHALPLLRRHGCTATLFVLPGRLDGDNAWDPLGPRKPLLGATGIRAAHDSGMEVASHSLTHVDLTRADDEQLQHEIAGSRSALVQLIGAPVDGFCYPYGYVDTRVRDAVRAAGYRYACAIDPGPLADDFTLPRVHIGQRDIGVRLWLKERLNRTRGRALPTAGSTSAGLPCGHVSRETAVRAPRDSTPRVSRETTPRVPRETSTGTSAGPRGTSAAPPRAVKP
ncbi:polysaccharide deacetylase family protein [Streptomyces spectabilis]|uniref:Polysaccharide deacetylase family protein n=1 Tax=Streptomyces spectabilis TaxID=68270 RepID=A0A516RAB1_STRST|nr:polysaccharide deacetylase family protein [Streptomyces spectabilis]